VNTAVTVALPRRVAERLRREAERQGLGFEEYIIELLTSNLDPKPRAHEYLEAAKELLGQARKELEEGDVRQAAGKVWGAAALAVKAYASLREGRRLTSHRELWEYAAKLGDEMGDWVDDVWNQANSMHICFYEGWCKKRRVEAALRRVERLVKAVEEALGAPEQAL
jgi:HEPN domain-containing protein